MPSLQTSGLHRAERFDAQIDAQQRDFEKQFCIENLATLSGSPCDIEIDGAARLAQISKQ